MPRNSGGTYSLPTGNPVVTATAISSTWANNTLADIKTELTDSLSRSGKGAMLAALALYEGTSALPGLAFSGDPNTGFYHDTADIMKLACGGVDVMWWTTSMAKLGGTAPNFQFEETDAAADNKLWDFLITAEDMKFRVLTDALAATEWMKVERTGGTVDKITLTASSIVLNGYTPSGVVTPDGNNAFTGSNTFSGVNVVSSTTPVWDWLETDGAADNKRWRAYASAERFYLAAANDALNSFGTIFYADRTGTTIDSVVFPGTAFSIGGTLAVTGAATFSSTVTASGFSGSGASLTSLPAGNLTGSVADARLSANVVKYNDGTANFTGVLQYGGIEVGYRGIPQNSQSGNYTCVLDDSGKEILHPSGGGAGDTFTIPSNASVAYPVGTVLVFTNRDSNALSIAITTDTMYISGTTTSGTRTLAQNGVATAKKVESTVWLISGSGLT